MDDISSHDPQKRKIEEKSNDLEDRIRKYREEKINIEKELEKSSIEKDVTLLTEQTEQEQGRFKITIDALSTSFSQFRKETEDFINNSKVALDANIDKFRRVSSHVVNTLYATLAIFSALFFGLYVYLNGMVLDKILIAGIVTIVGFFIIIKMTSKNINKKIDTAQTDGITELLKLNSKSPNLPDDYLKTGNFFNGLEKDATSLGSKVKEVFNLVRRFVPLMDNMYSSIDLRNNQVNFKKTLQNALLSYKIPLGDTKVTDYFHNFKSSSESEAGWLNQASQELIPFINIDSKITKLCYFDYINDLSNLPDATKTLIDDESNLTQFARLLLHNTIGEKPSKQNYDAFAEIIRNSKPIFRLTDFEKTYYNFSVNFKRKKMHLKSTITRLGYEIENVGQIIDNFVPPSLIEKRWEQALVEEVSKELGIKSKLLMLFYLDRVGEEQKLAEQWAEILDRENETLFSDFVNLITNRELLRVPDHYKEQSDLKKVVKKISETQSNFDFMKLKQQVYSKLKTIDEEKQAIVQSLKSYKIIIESANSENLFRSSIPLTDDTLTEIAKTFANEAVIADHRLVLLFYGSKYDKQIADKNFSQILEDDPTKLSEILIQNKLIKTDTGISTSDKENLIAIFPTVSEFNLVEIQSKYQNYSNLLEISKSLARFLSDEKLVEKTEVDLKQIMKVVPDVSGERVQNILSICSSLLNEANFSELEVIPVAMACTCLFLFARQDMSAKPCAERIQINSTALKILYQNMIMKEENMREGLKLKQIIAEVRDNPSLSYTYLSNFQQGLAIGILFRSTNEMMNKMINDFRKEMNKQEELRRDLHILEIAAKEFLNTELQNTPHFLEYAIQSQLVQAYVITSRSRQPIFTEVIDIDMMKKVAKENLGWEENLEDFLIISDSKQAKGVGNSTRVGVVPLNRNFDDFCKKFEELYEKTVEYYIEQNRNLNLNKSQFSINIFRMFASSNTFTRIRLKEGEVELSDIDNPIQIIRDLVMDKFSIYDRLELVVTSTPNAGNMVIKKLSEHLYKGQKIHFLLKEQLGGIYLANDVLKKTMEMSNFDEFIYNKFSVTDFVELAKKINGMISAEQEIRDVILSVLKEAFKKYDCLIQESELSSVSKSLFSKLRSTGKMLNY